MTKAIQFCDLKCAFASAAKEAMDGSRSCMTFTALWCDHFEKHVMKSQPCSQKKERPAQRVKHRRKEKQGF